MPDDRVVTYRPGIDRAQCPACFADVAEMMMTSEGLELPCGHLVHRLLITTAVVEATATEASCAPRSLGP